MLPVLSTRVPLLSRVLSTRIPLLSRVLSTQMEQSDLRFKHTEKEKRIVDKTKEVCVCVSECVAVR